MKHVTIRDFCKYSYDHQAKIDEVGRDLREKIESDLLCITDLFQNKSVAYF